MEKAELPCPICDRRLSPSAIDAHVNLCLNKLEHTSREIDGNVVEGTPKKRLKADTDSTVVGDQHRRHQGGTATWDFLGGISRKNKSSIAQRSFTTKFHKQPVPQPHVTLATVNKTAIPNDKAIRIPPGVSTGVSFEAGQCISEVSGPLQNHVIESSITKPAGKKPFSPLAEEMRPRCLGDYIGQEQVLGKKTLLRTLLESQQIPSMVIWGPPGCGKVSKYDMIINRHLCLV